MRIIVNVAIPPTPAFKDITNRSFVPRYLLLTIHAFSIALVVHLPAFLSFSVSLLVCFKTCKMLPKSVKLIVNTGNIKSLGSLAKTLFLF